MKRRTAFAEAETNVRRHVDVGDLDGLADLLVQVANECPRVLGKDQHRWPAHSWWVQELFRAQPNQVRHALATSLITRSPWIRGYQRGRKGVEIALAWVVGGPGYRVPDEVVSTLLAPVATEWTSGDCDQLVVLADLALRSGLPLPAPVVGVIRRTASDEYLRDHPVSRLAAELTDPVLNPGEAWADRVVADLPDLGAGWRALVLHATTARAAKPSARWEKTGRALLDAVGPGEAGRRIASWVGLAGRPRTVRLEDPGYMPGINDVFDPYNATALRGLVWLLGLLPPEPETARALGRLVETALRKVPGHGPCSPKTANAAVLALSRMDGEAALAQVARLAVRVTFKGTAKQLHAALDARAAALGLTRDEVEELAVPTYGLTDVGRRVEVLGDTTAELTVTGGQALLGWRTAAGRHVKAAPAAVRRDHADELKELTAAAKDVAKMLSAQAERLDRQFVARRRWRYADWRARYLDHPLVGTLGRRLIWLVDGQPCGYADTALRGLDDAALRPADDAVVELWHPIDRDVEEVLAWRDWLEQHGVTQPFKQAHREVYLLTAAEQNTRVYSNRFAGHILRQHQFNALAAVRGWRNALRMMVDDVYPPAVRELPQWGLRAEFWIEGVGDDWQTDCTDSGAYLRVATDQVRFYPVAAPENVAHPWGGGYEQWLPVGTDPALPLPLAEIPPLALSEVLRDVDLFVGVASVGNDPTWQDGGPEGRFREYWDSYSFGELSGTAETRRDLLTRLVPRLAIADRCTFDGRFLVVRGDLRTYKIHLGSGNILMSPNDQYLCIVAKQTPDAAATPGYLPFEGDRMVAVILSKAMLLARDTAITDPTIVQQIGR